MIFQFLKQKPWNVLIFLYLLFQSRAKLKDRISSEVKFDASVLPYRKDLLEYLIAEKALGRSIVLATAAHQSIADAVAKELKIFDVVLSSTPTINLKGKSKLAAIKQVIGDRFTYAGDSKADLPIWYGATSAILVGTSKRTNDRVSSKVPIERHFVEQKGKLKTWIRAIRIHQWLKNVLVFVPLLTSFSFSLNDVAKVVAAFISFSIIASATYILNDAWDIDNDRSHPRKRKRPFASAELPLARGLSLSVIWLILGITLATLISTNFLLSILIYLVLTTSYSLVFKKYVLLDVFMLANLYTLRIFAGATAIDVDLSQWLLAFSIFLFLSLAILKRCAELKLIQCSNGSIPRGRNYKIEDLVALLPLGISASFAASVIFGLFLTDPRTVKNYSTPQLLWVVEIGLVYWLCRLWIKTTRNEMHDDPVVFAIKDRGSLGVIALLTIIVLISKFFTLNISV